MEEEIKNNFEISEEQLEEIRNQAISRAKATKHKWVQRGGYIKCLSCTFQHGIRIRGGQIMQGLNKEGMPIIGSYRSKLD